MRCGCPDCDEYMVHAEGMELGCVCPYCGRRCTACLGTNTVLSPERLRSLQNDPVFLQQLQEDLEAFEDSGEEGSDRSSCQSMTDALTRRFPGL